MKTRATHFFCRPALAPLLPEFELQKHYLERNNAVLRRQADRFERLGQNERSKRLAENQTVLK